MTPAAIEERLRTVARLREERRAPPCDLSPEAVARRLETVARLRQLCLELAIR
jgi:hypothetical protein